MDANLSAAIEKAKAERAAGSKTYQQIAEDWKTAGLVSSRTGKPFSYVTVRHLILNGGEGTQVQQAIVEQPKTEMAPIPGPVTVDRPPTVVNQPVSPISTLSATGKILVAMKKIIDIPEVEEEHRVRMLQVLMGELPRTTKIKE